MRIPSLFKWDQNVRISQVQDFVFLQIVPLYKQIRSGRYLMIFKKILNIFVTSVSRNFWGKYHMCLLCPATVNNKAWIWTKFSIIEVVLSSMNMSFSFQSTGFTDPLSDGTCFLTFYIKVRRDLLMF